MGMANPFTPTFGIIPPFMTGREALIEELSSAFSNGLGDPNLCTIVSRRSRHRENSAAFAHGLRSRIAGVDNRSYHCCGRYARRRS